MPRERHRRGRLRLRACAMPVATRGGERHSVVACVSVGVRDVLSASCLSVTKVPLEALDLLAAGVGGGGAGELGWCAATNRGVIEVGCWLGIDDDSLGGGAVAL